MKNIPFWRIPRKSFDVSYSFDAKNVALYQLQLFYATVYAHNLKTL